MVDPELRRIQTSSGRTLSRIFCDSENDRLYARLQIASDLLLEVKRVNKENILFAEEHVDLSNVLQDQEARLDVPHVGSACRKI